MKKLVSLIMVLTLVLCLATAVAAEGESSWTSPIMVEELPETVELAAGASVFYCLDPNTWSGYTLSVTDQNVQLQTSQMGPQSPDLSGSVSASLSQNSLYGIVIGIFNADAENGHTFTLNLEAPPKGTSGNPEVITDLSSPITVTTIEAGWDVLYCLTWTAGEVGGEFKISNVVGAENNMDGLMGIDINMGNYSYDYETGVYTANVGPGETVSITVMSYIPGDTFTFECSFEKGALGTYYNPIVIEDQAKPYSFDVELKTESYDYGDGYVDTWSVPVYYKLSDVEGAILTIEDPHAIIEPWGNAIYDNDENDDVLTIQLQYLENGEAVIGVCSQSIRDKVYTVTVSEPEGYDENPEELKDIAEIEAEIEGWGNDSYYYNWTATEAGKLDFSVSDAEWHEDIAEWLEEYDVPVELTILVNGKEAVAGEDAVSLNINKGDVVTIVVTVLPLFEGDQAGQPAYVTVAGTIDPAGSESNPIRVNAAADLAGIDVAAGGKTYIAINSQLNGQILVINGDADTAVTLNGKELTAVNGVFTAELTGTPVNALVVTNKGEAAATYTAGINYAAGTAGNPISVTTEQSVTGKVEAGAEIHYLLNSKLSGAVLTVKGEGAYIIVDGVKTEAKDGVIKLTLEAKNPTISLVIGNTGSAAASVVLAHSDNPPTGDLSIVAPAAALLVSAMGTVALVIKKKEF